VTQVSIVTTILAIKWVSANKNHRGKTLQLTMEVQNGLIERLVDRGASMSVMAAWIVRELAGKAFKVAGVFQR
jgi:hypothetical protein